MGCIRTANNKYKDTLVLQHHNLQYYASPIVSGTVITLSNSAVSTETHGDASTQAIWQRLEAKTRNIQTDTDTYLQNMQQQYKVKYGRSICTTPTFRLGGLKFICRHALSGTNSSMANSIAPEAYNKLLPQNLGPLHITAVRSPAFEVDEHGIDNPVLIGRSKRAPPIANFNINGRLTPSSR